MPGPFSGCTAWALLGKKAAIHEELDQWQAAVDAWQAVLKMDACHETAYQNLMILHADAGKKSDAVHLFQQCHDRLAAELDARARPGDHGHPPQDQSHLTLGIVTGL